MNDQVIVCGVRTFRRMCLPSHRTPSRAHWLSKHDKLALSIARARLEIVVPPSRCRVKKQIHSKAILLTRRKSCRFSSAAVSLISKASWRLEPSSSGATVGASVMDRLMASVAAVESESDIFCLRLLHAVTSMSRPSCTPN